jgi:hypothetical protein
MLQAMAADWRDKKVLLTREYLRQSTVNRTDNALVLTQLSLRYHRPPHTTTSHLHPAFAAFIHHSSHPSHPPRTFAPLATFATFATFAGHG